MAAMQRVAQAPNLMIATLWTDMLRRDGISATVQRAFSSSIVGGIPPDQGLPEIWVEDDFHHARAVSMLRQLQHPPEHRWACTGCAEVLEGPFEQCWNCGALRPGAN